MSTARYYTFKDYSLHLKRLRFPYGEITRPFKLAKAQTIKDLYRNLTNRNLSLSRVLSDSLLHIQYRTVSQYALR